MVKIKRKTCKHCGGTYSEAFFYANSKSVSHGLPKHYSFKRLICIGCQLSQRTERKRRNRPREKARRTLRHHADKYIRLGLARSKDEFAGRYGWDLDQMAHDIKHSYGNGCPYCHELFAQMGNGLADLTLDILNPVLAPYYETNTLWACATCNQEKQRTPPDLWGAKLQDWKAWRKRQLELQRDPWVGTLFEGMDILPGSMQRGFTL